MVHLGEVAPPRVLGLDLSLTASGLAGNGYADTIKPPAKLRDVARLDWIRREILDRYLYQIDLAVMEGPSYGSARQSQSGHHERAGLWWVVRVAIEHNGVPLAIVSPKGRAKYATGNGNAGKDDVVREVARRFDWFEGDNNAADALILAAMGADHLGVPMATMPATHRVALDAVAWPETVRVAA